MQVKVIRQSGQSALVEYADQTGPHRVTVPVSVICANEVADTELALGIEHGVQWEALIKLRVTPETIAAELRNRGIWTIEDLLSKPQEVKGAIMTLVGNQYAQLANAAKAQLEVTNG